MVEWGYSINKDMQIDFDANSRKVNNILLEKEPSFALCFSCGTCTATCSTGNFTDFNIRKIFTLVKRGETNGLKEQVKECMFCGKCKLVCPRGVNTRNIIFQLSKLLEN